MGLFDILNGMQNGPRGRPSPDDKGGMSPMTMALLALLAYKAYQRMSGGAVAAPPGDDKPRLPGNAAGAGPAGGLDNLLKGGLGGLLAGGAAGGLLGSGLDDLLKGLRNNGLGEAADSWVSTGPNRDVAPGDLAKAIGLDDIDAIAGQTGLSRDDLLAGLSQQLPGLIDQLTPDGRLPTDDEISRWA